MAIGRPSAINRVVAQRRASAESDDLVDVTVSDRIVELVRAGSFFALACNAAGVTKETGYEWIRKAGLARVRTSGLRDGELTDHERDCLAFADAIVRAEGDAAARNQLIADRLIRGGTPITTTTTTEKRDAKGNLVETVTVTRTEETLPDGAMLRWWFEHKHHDLYVLRASEDDARTTRLGDEEHAESMVANIAQWRAQREREAEEAPAPKKVTGRRVERPKASGNGA